MQTSTYQQSNKEANEKNENTTINHYMVIKKWSWAIVEKYKALDRYFFFKQINTGTAEEMWIVTWGIFTSCTFSVTFLDAKINWKLSIFHNILICAEEDQNFVQWWYFLQGESLRFQLAFDSYRSVFIYICDF